MHIHRIGGTDPDGILSIGRSGLRTAKTSRTLGKRLREFWKGYHSEAYTFGLARAKLGRLPQFLGFHLWASIVSLDDDREIAKTEIHAMRRYFDRFLELPPFNGAFPGR